jgi:hypothetical protein
MEAVDLVSGIFANEPNSTNVIRIGDIYGTPTGNISTFSYDLENYTIDLNQVLTIMKFRRFFRKILERILPRKETELFIEFAVNFASLICSTSPLGLLGIRSNLLGPLGIQSNLLFQIRKLSLPIPLVSDFSPEIQFKSEPV